MEKFLILSDLHTDLAGHDPPENLTGVAGILAAGDIGPGVSGLNWLLDNIPRYLNVIYVPGNHEYYKHNYPALLKKLRVQAKGTNVHVLNNESVKLHGITFLGTTLWTDFRLKGKGQSFWAMSRAQRQMNDYRQIRMNTKGYRTLLPQDTQEFHLKAYLSQVLPPKYHYCTLELLQVKQAEIPWVEVEALITQGLDNLATLAESTAHTWTFSKKFVESEILQAYGLEQQGKT